MSNITSKIVGEEFTQIWHKDLSKIHAGRLTEEEIVNREYSEGEHVKFWETKTYGRPKFPAIIAQITYHPEGKYIRAFIRSEYGLAGVLAVSFRGRLDSISELKMIMNILDRSHEGLKREI